ncbi:tissue factor-like [Archocentrus centrarchus]|uniref:tissue factor-like n=1 Tax=Archocentrus centrarchus TaxID=63155 RepID=UPI0011EA1CF5|nr:tissue factor-like [Archocentrus centrarchus]
MERALSPFSCSFFSLQLVLKRAGTQKGHGGTNMASVNTLLWLGVCLSGWNIISADENSFPKAENVRWLSLDFITILQWSVEPSDYTYTVLFSVDDDNWDTSNHCIKISASECDLTTHLQAFDRTYTADIQTETTDDDLPHTFSPKFNPYRESNISAVEFTVDALDDRRVIVNITDPLTTIYIRGKQQSIRDILQKDLKYKISYHKSGSTGKRDIISDSSVAEVEGLDAGESYCFMVAAFIPSRPKATQQGAWSTQHCTQGHKDNLQDLSVGAWVGAGFIVLTVLIVIITVTVLCCRQRNKTLQMSQSSASV